MRDSVSVPHMRYLRHRKLEGLVRGASGGGQDVSHLSKLGAWTEAREAELDGTSDSIVFTANPATDELTVTAHGRATGDGPLVVESNDTLPAGLFFDTQYWAFVIDVNTLTLHRTREEAVKDINAVDITDTGTGVHGIFADSRSEGVVTVVRQGVSTDTIQAADDMDDLI